MKRALLLVSGSLLVAAGHADAVWPWTPGQEPFAQPGAPSSARCGACHEEEHAQWAASRHHSSWTNDLMLVGFAAEPLEFCVNCHAPSPEAAAEIRNNRMFYATLAPEPRGIPGSVARAPEPKASEGIGCSVCHWREGKVLAPGQGFGPHESVPTPELRQGEFCLPCHEFTMPETVDGHTVQTGTLMQATGTEWRAWREAGGTETCQDCHMPGGSHQVRGAHDRAFLQGAVRIEAKRIAGEVQFRLRTVGVGHHMPTGDLFRSMSLEVREKNTQFRTIRRFMRHFEVRSGVDGLPSKQLVDDSTLVPDVWSEVRTPSNQPMDWRLVWHDGSLKDETRGLLDPDSIRFVLAEGELP